MSRSPFSSSPATAAGATRPLGPDSADAVFTGPFLSMRRLSAPTPCLTNSNLNTVCPPNARSGATGLDVDAASAPCHELSRGPQECQREQYNGSGQRSGARRTGQAAHPGPRAANRVVEVGTTWQRADQPVQPAEHDLAAPPV